MSCKLTYTIKLTLHNIDYILRHYKLENDYKVLTSLYKMFAFKIKVAVNITLSSIIAIAQELRSDN